jgi:uncharacterized protein YbjT (DUF2867 family)
MIIVTAPTGAIGHQVLEHVLLGQEPIRVIARDPSRLPPHVRDRIDVVQGSHSDAAVVNKAFADADAVSGRLLRVVSLPCSSYGSHVGLTDSLST